MSIVEAQKSQIEETAKLMQEQRAWIRNESGKKEESSASEIKTSGEDQIMDEDEKRITEALQAVEKKGLSAKVEASINKACGWMRRKLRQQSNSSDHIHKLKDRATKLKDGLIPAGMKPFKLPYESTIFQEELEGDKIFKVDIKAGTTSEKAKMCIYQHFNFWNNALDLEVEEKRKAQLRETTSLRSFLKMCESATKELEAEKIDFAAEYDAPPGLFSEKMELARTLATKKYKQLIEAEIEEKRSSKEKKGIQQKKDKEILEKAAKLQPVEVLEKWADDIIDQKLGKQKKVGEETKIDYANMLSIEVREPTILDKAIPQNAASLGAAQGHNHKGKGRGKSSPKGQGKKGLSKGTWKGKEASAKGMSGKGSTKGKGKGSWKDPTPTKGYGKPNKGKVTKSGGKGKAKSGGKGKKGGMWR